MRSWVLLLALCVILTTRTVVAQAPAKYGGIDVCKGCHSETYDDWSKTPHARGFELLVNVGEQKNAACLPCHTTAYGSGGYVDEASTPGLKGITCEACHGPGADHNGVKSKIQRTPSVKTCSGCHQKINIHSTPQ